jgi:hypothetical protein
MIKGYDMRRIGAAAAVLVLAGTTLGTAAGTAGAETGTAAGRTVAAACATGWGSGAKGGAAVGADHLRNIRTGRHACYDRMVFEVPGGGRVSHHVQYVKRLVTDGGGQYIPVKGGAILDIRIGAWSYDLEAGAPTYPGKVGKRLPGVDVTGYNTFRDTRFGGTFEGQTQVGLGVRARLPFRVLQLSDRVVVDVAHRW